MMTPYRRLLLFILFCFPFTKPFAQTLSFADLLQVYSLDSSAARQFCTDKKFALTTAGNTGANMRYQFTTADSSTRLEIKYPNDSASPNVQMNYWFRSAADYNRFKRDLRKHHFTQQSAKQVSGTLPSYAARYINKNMQVELIRPEGKQPYWLFLHPVGDYTW